MTTGEIGSHTRVETHPGTGRQAGLPGSGNHSSRARLAQYAPTGYKYDVEAERCAHKKSDVLTNPCRGLVGWIERAKGYKTASWSRDFLCFGSSQLHTVISRNNLSRRTAAVKMKSFAVLSLLSLGVSGANLGARQQRGPPNRGGRPTGGGTVVFSQLPQTTARIQTTIRITTTLRTSATAKPSAAPVCEWTGHCIGKCPS